MKRIAVSLILLFGALVAIACLDQNIREEVVLLVVMFVAGGFGYLLASYTSGHRNRYWSFDSEEE